MDILQDQQKMMLGVNGTYRVVFSRPAEDRRKIEDDLKEQAEKDKEGMRKYIVLRKQLKQCRCEDENRGRNDEAEGRDLVHLCNDVATGDAEMQNLEKSIEALYLEFANFGRAYKTCRDPKINAVLALKNQMQTTEGNADKILRGEMMVSELIQQSRSLDEELLIISETLESSQNLDLDIPVINAFVC